MHCGLQNGRQEERLGFVYCCLAMLNYDLLTYLFNVWVARFVIALSKSCRHSLFYYRVMKHLDNFKAVFHSTTLDQ